MEPTPAQARALSEYCGHARFVWNLAVEQHAWWRPGRRAAPSWVDQSAQLTEARREFAWLRAGSHMVQQQALRDFAQAMAFFFAGTCRRPGFRKAGRKEGFRIVAVKPGWIRRLSRRVGQVRVPKLGWVRFRWSRPVPAEVKSYRVTCDRAGRWHVAFAAIPEPTPGPGTGEVVGIDRGIAVSAALSTGEKLVAPRLSAKRAERLVRIQRRLAKAKRGSNRRARLMKAAARLYARESDARRDWVEKLSTDVARRFDLIRVEDLNIRAMTRSARGTVAEPGRNVRAKAGLNRGIIASCWRRLVVGLERKAPGRVEKIKARYTSQICSACGHHDPAARESQARFRCRACGLLINADVNAAMNIAMGGIAAGRAVTARGGAELEPANREPQLVTSQ